VLLKRLFQVLVAVNTMTANAADKILPDENFMLVLREVEGINKLEFGYRPTGQGTGNLVNGEVVTFEGAWFDLIGDMHVRFVIDGETSMNNLTAEKFAAYGLTPKQAVDVAIRNIRTRYGEPNSQEWEAGIMLVSGKSPDFDSSYFLDRAFWDGLLKKYPEGLVVGVPERGGLVYAPVSDGSAVSVLESNIAHLYQTSGAMRVSSALYLYKGGTWTVHRNPMSLH